MGAPDFTGFPDGTFRFLADIAEHNERPWFEAHRRDYEQYYLAPARALVEALGPRLRTISRSVSFEPKVNGSIFRINRDVRFSSDKSPYKTHLDLWFWEGEHRGWAAPGFFFRMSADRLIIGTGMHRFAPEQLERYREAVLDDRRGRALHEAMEKVQQAGAYAIGGATRRQVPRGYDPAHARARLLHHEGLWAELIGPLPAPVRSPAFVEHCLAHYRAMFPITRWMLRNLSLAS
jgi:uncharacterized protein (TIGR02453 family)